MGFSSLGSILDRSLEDQVPPVFLNDFHSLLQRSAPKPAPRSAPGARKVRTLIIFIDYQRI